ncbi:hypothetical protein B0H19DRAFT_1071893 [Mycena capillaripes]|nr:hypothetical protein B0H19DRAFT_1071893 [Mycena capillaripes]
MEGLNRQRPTTQFQNAYLRRAPRSKFWHIVRHDVAEVLWLTYAWWKRGRIALPVNREEGMTTSVPIYFQRWSSERASNLGKATPISWDGDLKKVKTEPKPPTNDSHERNALDQLADERPRHHSSTRQAEIILQQHHVLGDEDLVDPVRAGDLERIGQLQDARLQVARYW